jgi:hypothetical protein
MQVTQHERDSLPEMPGLQDAQTAEKALISAGNALMREGAYNGKWAEEFNKRSAAEKWSKLVGGEWSPQAIAAAKEILTYLASRPAHWRYHYPRNQFELIERFGGSVTAHAHHQGVKLLRAKGYFADYHVSKAAPVSYNLYSADSKALTKALAKLAIRSANYKVTRGVFHLGSLTPIFGKFTSSATSRAQVQYVYVTADPFVKRSAKALAETAKAHNPKTHGNVDPYYNSAAEVIKGLRARFTDAAIELALNYWIKRGPAKYGNDGKVAITGTKSFGDNFEALLAEASLARLAGAPAPGSLAREVYKARPAETKELLAARPAGWDHAYHNKLGYLDKLDYESHLVASGWRKVPVPPGLPTWVDTWFDPPAA